jgi:hypothetical protein
MTRQAVTQHLAIVQAANLIAISWRGHSREVDPWKMVYPDGRITDTGEVVLH